MLVPMTKEQFVARMIADAKKQQERKANAKRAVTEYIYDRINQRQHKYHRDAPKRRLGTGK